jgi:hypothetical protein
MEVRRMPAPVLPVDVSTGQSCGGCETISKSQRRRRRLRRSAILKSAEASAKLRGALGSLGHDVGLSPAVHDGVRIMCGRLEAKMDLLVGRLEGLVNAATVDHDNLRVAMGAKKHPVWNGIPAAELERQCQAVYCIQNFWRRRKRQSAPALLSPLHSNMTGNEVLQVEAEAEVPGSSPSRGAQCGEPVPDTLLGVVPSSSMQRLDAETGEWVCTEPKRPASAYFLFLNHQKQALKVPLVQLKGAWAQLRSEEQKWWTAQAETLKDEYEGQMMQWKQHGRYLKSRGVKASFNPPLPEAVPEAGPSSVDELPSLSPSGGPPAPAGMGCFVTVQHFEDGLRAGLEGMARVTGTHLSKLERRVAAIEESTVVHSGSSWSQLTTMTGLTRVIQGYRHDPG